MPDLETDVVKDQRIWSRRRQILGNCVPLGLGCLVAAPAYFAWGGLVSAVLSIFAILVGINYFGFYENAQIERAMRRLQADGELIGFVFDRPPTVYDAHAEIGLLTIEPDSLRIQTQDRDLLFGKESLIQVKRKFNIHSAVGLGGWISLHFQDLPPLLIESRKYPTMLKSRMRTSALKAELKSWAKKEKAPLESGAFSESRRD